LGQGKAKKKKEHKGEVRGVRTGIEFGEKDRGNGRSLIWEPQIQNLGVTTEKHGRGPIL